MKRYLPPVFIALLLATFLVSPALALGPTPQEDVGTGLFALAEFLRNFVLSSVTLATLTAMIVNVIKPLIPIGYADTAAVLVGFVIVVIVAALKIFNPSLDLAGIDALFKSIIDSSVVWLLPLTMLVAWLAKVIHKTFLKGLPLIGRSNEKPNIFSPNAARYHKFMERVEGPPY